MATESVTRVILTHERGTVHSKADIAKQVHPKARQLTNVHQLQALPAVTGDSFVTYIRSRENFLVYLDNRGRAFFRTGPEWEQIVELSQPRETTLKLLLESNTLVSVVKCASSRYLQFFRFNIDALLAGESSRERILTSAKYTLGALRQVDSKHGKVIFEADGVFTVWDLYADSAVYSNNVSAMGSFWYSRNHIIGTVADACDCLLLNILDLDSGNTQSVRVLGVSEVAYVDWLGTSLLIAGDSCGIQLIDLATQSTTSLGQPDLRVFIEMEQTEDSLLIYTDGRACFARASDQCFDCHCDTPLFADTKDALVLFQENKLTVVLNNTGTLLTTSLEVPHEVTAIGVNEDTLEIFAACGNGLLLVFH